MNKQIAWWKPLLGTREKDLVCRVIEANFPNEGEYTDTFEKGVAELCGVPYAVAATSGTAALFLALKACEVGPGDQVIVPNCTFIATANAVRLAGAEPVLVDVDPRSFCIDVGATERAITRRTRAIIPVHVSGRAADMPRLLALAEGHGFRVIEDAAEALGSRNFGRALGSLGDLGCFSFSAYKTITTGQGGMVVTSNKQFVDRLRELKDQGRPVRGTGGADEHRSTGYNFKLTNLQAAVGVAQLEDLPRRLSRLRSTYEIYERELRGVQGVTLPGFDLQAGECPQWVDAEIKGRDSLQSYLRARGVHTREFWRPLHTQAPYADAPGPFPASEAVASQGLWLSSALDLDDTDVAAACGLIREWAHQTL
jgi:perosamine synthetase